MRGEDRDWELSPIRIRNRRKEGKIIKRNYNFNFFLYYFYSKGESSLLPHDWGEGN
jgi:hypothetical protein